MITFIDIFAGIGGFRLGFESKKTRCVFSCEIDKNAKITYRKNFQGKLLSDIRRIKKIPNHDILLAGFPDSFRFPKIKDWHLYTQIGNSVCVPIVKKLANKMILSLKEEEK